MLKQRGKNKIWAFFALANKSLLWQAKVCILLITLFSALPDNSQAANLHTLSDKMSRAAPGIASDHLLKFTTPTGLNAADQYIRISFASGFDLSAIDYTDIDLFHGSISGLENQEILNALPTSTAWGAQVSGSRIDLTHPNSAVFGNILPGDKIIIKIGLNAESGSRQIINPVSAGSKIITINSNNGDSGKLAVAIYEDQIGVGGQTAGVLPNPSVLNNPFNITANSMGLSWSQNNDFDFDHYELYRGDSAGVTNLTAVLVFSANNHFLTETTVSGLAAGRNYYFVLYIFDTEGQSTPSNEVIARTLGGGVTPPPQQPPPPTPPPPTPEEEKEIINEETIFEKMGNVDCDEGRCAYFSPDTVLKGHKPLKTIIYVNDSPYGVNYPTAITWEYPAILRAGVNSFMIYAMDEFGQISNRITLEIKLYKVGDSNGDSIVNDFDLSTLVAHFGEPWCFSDFNMDNMVNDFDLSALARQWDGIY